MSNQIVISEASQLFVILVEVEKLASEGNLFKFPGLCPLRSNIGGLILKIKET